MKKCYYELLGLERTATSDEIKNAYRKKALQVHPDKNPSADAKELFQQLNEAYNVLSDPNERTWYDNHRTQILSNDPHNKEEQEFGLNIWPFFSSNCYQSFTDEPDGFYAVYRGLFEKIKEMEATAYDNNDEVEEDFVKLPGFGDSKTNLEKIDEFYHRWENFSTYQNFAFADLYNPNEAENRQIRRLIEKENKKERQKEKNEYLKIIKSLIEFVRKRDPRYKELQRVQKENEEKRNAEKKRLKEEEKKYKQEMRKLALQEELKRYQEEEENADIVVEEVKDLDARDFYCEICDKEFKTENQLKNHNQSKIHVKKVKELLDEVGIEDEKEKVMEGMKEKEKKSKNKKKKKKKKMDNNEEKEEEEEPKEEKTKQENENLQKKEENEEEEEEEDEDDLDFHSFGKYKLQKQSENNVQKETEEEKKENQEQEDTKAKDEDEEKFEKLEKKTKKNKKNRKNLEKNELDEKKEKEQEIEKPPEQAVAPEKKEEPEKKEKSSETFNKKEEKFEKVDKKVKNFKSTKEKPKNSDDSFEKEKQPNEEFDYDANEKKGTNKAKLRKLKKKERDTNINTVSELVCNICKEKFDSKNKLFKHLKEKNHEMKI